MLIARVRCNAIQVRMICSSNGKDQIDITEQPPQRRRLRNCLCRSGLTSKSAGVFRIELAAIGSMKPEIGIDKNGMTIILSLPR